MSEVVIAGAARTPVGAFNGALANLTAAELGTVAIVNALERAGIRSLADGQAVTFDIEAGRDGRESATNLALA